jgi:hypothetical protein
VAEIETLTDEERDLFTLTERLDEYGAERDALRAEVERLQGQLDELGQFNGAFESRLAAADALLRRCLDDFECQISSPAEADRIVSDIRAHLAAQPAAPDPTLDAALEQAHPHLFPAPTRTEADQRVLEACAAWSLEVTARAADGSTVTQYGDPLPVVRAELARRGMKP